MSFRPHVHPRLPRNLFDQIGELVPYNPRTPILLYPKVLSPHLVINTNSFIAPGSRVRSPAFSFLFLLKEKGRGSFFVSTGSTTYKTSQIVFYRFTVRFCLHIYQHGNIEDIMGRHLPTPVCQHVRFLQPLNQSGPKLEICFPRIRRSRSFNLIFKYFFPLGYKYHCFYDLGVQGHDSCFDFYFLALNSSFIAG